jgi:hypothetical protein
MKKVFLVSLMLLVFGLAATASAQDRHQNDGHKRHDWSHNAYQQKSWHHTTAKSPVSVNWYQHRSHYTHDRYRMERIHDRGWHDRFPGLHPYRWHDRHGEGFWYHGRRITDAVFFYNNSDELVSIGFMHNGSFIFIRDDHNGFENRDHFFLSWWNSH